MCARLERRLRQASRATTRRDRGTTSLQLRGFLQDLASGRGIAGTPPVNDSAFSLLQINAEYLLGRIPHLPTAPRD